MIAKGMKGRKEIGGDLTRKAGFSGEGGGCRGHRGGFRLMREEQNALKSLGAIGSTVGLAELQVK